MFSTRSWLRMATPVMSFIGRRSAQGVTAGVCGGFLLGSTMGSTWPIARTESIMDKVSSLAAAVESLEAKLSSDLKLRLVSFEIGGAVHCVSRQFSSSA